MPEALVNKALSVASSTASLYSYLPAPLAQEVIEWIRELNVMRRMINVFKQNSRTWKKPKRSSGMSAYFIPDGTTATLSGFTSTSVEWIAKKLMCYVMVDEEAIEDSQPDVVAQVLRDFADAVAEAEELALLAGDPTHLATAPTPASATVANWYVRDARLMFEGIFPTAASVAASTSVNGGGAAISEDMVNKAVYNLGKYGRNKGQLIGLLPSVQAAQVRQSSSFKNANTSGLALASFISGLGSAGEANGLVTVIYGVPFFEVPQATAGSAVIMNKRACEMGDRRMIKSESERVIESDQRKYVTSERISFNYNYRDMLVAITNLSTTLA